MVDIMRIIERFFKSIIGSIYYFHLFVRKLSFFLDFSQKLIVVSWSFSGVFIHEFVEDFHLFRTQHFAHFLRLLFGDFLIFDSQSYSIHLAGLLGCLEAFFAHFLEFSCDFVKQLFLFCI